MSTIPTSRRAPRRAWLRRIALAGVVAVAAGAGGLAVAAGTPKSTGTPGTFVAVTPCRIMDTRADSTVGPRALPIGAIETYTIQVRGASGNCTIPNDATAVNLNITSVNPTGASFLTVWPADSARPLSSALNWIANQPPTPNSINVGLSNSGQVSFYNNAGTVDLVADVTGYYVSGQRLPAPTSCGATLRWDLPQCTTSSFDLPAFPNSMTFDGTNLWVASSEQSNVTRIDRGTGKMTTFAMPGLKPVDIAFDGTWVWTANTFGGVSRIDPATGVFTSFPVAGASMGGLFFDGTSLWKTNDNQSSLTRIDPSTGSSSLVAMPAGAQGSREIAYDGSSLWVTNIGNKVSRIDPDSGTGANFDLPAGAVGPAGIVFDGTSIWTANITSSNVTRIDPTTGAGENVSLPGDANGTIAIAFDGTDIWTTSFVSSKISRIDADTGRGVNVAFYGASPIDIVFDGTNMWTISSFSNSIARLSS